MNRLARRSSGSQSGSARLANRMVGLLYVAGAVFGLLSAVIPHGRDFNVTVDLIAVAAAASVGVGVWVAPRLTRRWIHMLLGFASCMVAGGVLTGNGNDVSTSAAVIFVWVAIAAALFLPAREAAAQVAGSGVAYAVVLALSGNSGAPAEWVFVIGTAVVGAAVTARSQAEMNRLATTDHLTGLPNRQALYQALEREMARASRLGQPLALALVDLDGFKAINDRMGHLAGDEALIQLSRTWQEALRPTDVLARFGGDEFVLVMPNTTLSGAETVLDRLGHSRRPCGWSVGVATWDARETTEELFTRADRSLYQSKNGRETTRSEDQATASY